GRDDPCRAGGRGDAMADFRKTNCRETIVGTPASDLSFISGGFGVVGGGDDRFEGRGGNDAASGGKGDDRLCGNAGRDTLFAGIGDDQLWDEGAGRLCGMPASTGCSCLPAGRDRSPKAATGTTR
ncbi:MAG: hypothetical protein ACK4OP_05120, partial [Gemmobacter sp.]